MPLRRTRPPTLRHRGGSAGAMACSQPSWCASVFRSRLVPRWSGRTTPCEENVRRPFGLTRQYTFDAAGGAMLHSPKTFSAFFGKVHHPHRSTLINDDSRQGSHMAVKFPRSSRNRTLPFVGVAIAASAALALTG